MKKKISIKKILKLFIFFILIIYVLVTLLSYFFCYYTASKLPLPVPQEMLRVKLYGSTYSSTGNTVSGSITIVDSNGYEVAVIERSWSGSYLAVEFLDYNYKNLHYIFPSRIYGKNKIIEEKHENKKGTNLIRYYNINNQCKLYGRGYSNDDRSNFSILSTFISKYYPFSGFGQIKKVSVDLSGCRPELYYSIGINKLGKIYVSEI